jgi:hypothetical protein
MSSLDAQQTDRIAEISGWDADENFFVEKAVFHPERASNKVGLRARLRVGSMVFVRVSDGASMYRTVPATYQVARIKGNVSNGAREVHLIPLRPKEEAARTLLEFTFHETMLN